MSFLVQIKAIEKKQLVLSTSAATVDLSMKTPYILMILSFGDTHFDLLTNGKLQQKVTLL